MKKSKKALSSPDLPFYLSPYHFGLFSVGILLLSAAILFIYLMPTGSRESELSYINQKQATERSSFAQTNNLSLCPDLNNDQTINSLDISLIQASQGQENSKLDLNLDGTVNADDTQIVINNFGKKC